MSNFFFAPATQKWPDESLQSLTVTLVSRCQTPHENSERESGDTSIPNQFFWNVSGRGHVNHYSSRGRDIVPERAAVDAAKELGYDSLKDLQLAVIRGIVSWQ